MITNQNFNITVIGNSAAIPAGGHHLSSQLINIHQVYFLIDCGEGTQIELLKHHTKYHRIDHILISHLHGDHFYGLPGLLSTFNLLNRTRDIHIYCPENIEIYLQNTFNISHTSLKYNVHFHLLDTVNKSLIYENKNFTLHSFPLEHRVATCGFIFNEKPKAPNIKKSFIERYKPAIEDIHKVKNGGDYIDKGNVIKNNDITTPPKESLSYAYCSDTKYNTTIPKYISGVNLVYHEATFYNSMQQLASEKFHSTASDAAKTAKLAKAKQLLLGHFSARLNDLDILKNEATIIFPNTEISIEGSIYSPE